MRDGGSFTPQSLEKLFSQMGVTSDERSDAWRLTGILPMNAQNQLFADLIETPFFPTQASRVQLFVLEVLFFCATGAAAMGMILFPDVDNKWPIPTVTRRFLSR